MKSYQTLQRKLVGLAFVLGPLLMVIGALTYVLGIGLIPSGQDSWINSVLMIYGGLVMIPVYFELARLLGQRAPIYGAICAIAGLSWGLFTSPGTLNLLEQDLINLGITEPVMTMVPTWGGWIPVFVGLAVLHLTPILFGVGFLWKGGIPRWSAGLLIVGALALGIGVGVDDGWWILFYPLFTVSFLIALAPIGVRYLTGDSQARELGVATA
jgi:hypothetical protein